jgi:hypothetical protein
MKLKDQDRDGRAPDSFPSVTSTFREFSKRRNDDLA